MSARRPFGGKVVCLAAQRGGVNHPRTASLATSRGTHSANLAPDTLGRGQGIGEGRGRGGGRGGTGRGPGSPSLETVAEGLSEMVNSKVEWCNINNTQLQKPETIAEVLSEMVNSRILLWYALQKPLVLLVVACKI